MAHWGVLRDRSARVMRPGVDEWPVGQSRPLTNSGTLTLYAIGEFMCAGAGHRPELVGRVALFGVQDLRKRRASPDVLSPPPPRPCTGRRGTWS